MRWRRKVEEVYLAEEWGFVGGEGSRWVVWE